MSTSVVPAAKPAGEAPAAQPAVKPAVIRPIPPTVQRKSGGDGKTQAPSALEGRGLGGRVEVGPGIYERADGDSGVDPFILEAEERGDADKRRGGKQHAEGADRHPDGRFKGKEGHGALDDAALEGPGDADDGVLEEPGAAEQPPVPTTEAPPTADGLELEFAGKKYTGKPAIESFLRQFKGELSARDRKANELNARLKEAEDTVHRWANWAQTQARTTQGQDETARGRAGEQGGAQPTRGSAAAEAGATETDADSFVEGFDWSQFDRVSEERGPKVALIWTLLKFEKAMRTAVPAPIKELLAERERTAAEHRVVSESVEFLRELKDAVDPETGEPAYPELQQHDGTAHAVVELWRKIASKLHPDVRYTQDAFELAVLKYRQRKGSSVSGLQGRQQPTPTPAVQAPEPAAVAAAARIAREVAEGRGVANGTLASGGRGTLPHGRQRGEDDDLFGSNDPESSDTLQKYGFRR